MWREACIAGFPPMPYVLWWKISFLFTSKGLCPNLCPTQDLSIANATDNMAWRTIPEANGDHFSFNTPTDMSSIGSCRSVVVVG